MNVRATVRSKARGRKCSDERRKEEKSEDECASVCREISQV